MQSWHGDASLVDSANVISELTVVAGRAYYVAGERHTPTIRSYAWGDAAPMQHLANYRYLSIYPGQNHAIAVGSNRGGPHEVWLLGDDPAATKLLELEKEPEHVTELDGNVVILVEEAESLRRQLLSVPVPSADAAKIAQVDALYAAIQSDDHNPNYDFNGDEVVDQNDVEMLLREKRGTTRADLNLDGAVDFADFLTLSSSFGDTEATWSQGDLDGDGEVGFADFLVLSQLFGKEVI